MRKMFSEKQIKEFIANQKKDITTLVDYEGHDRFIEGDIEIEEITGVNQTYGKWSLSATHLMMVVAGTIADTTAITTSNPFFILVLPDWIMDKIYPTFSNIIEAKTVAVYDYNGGTQNAFLSFRKTNDDLRLLISITATADRYFRFAFDLLIDSD